MTKPAFFPFTSSGPASKSDIHQLAVLVLAHRIERCKAKLRLRSLSTSSALLLARLGNNKVL